MYIVRFMYLNVKTKVNSYGTFDFQKTNVLCIALVGLHAIYCDVQYVYTGVIAKLNEIVCVTVVWLVVL